jgi:hypothetical protein
MTPRSEMRAPTTPPPSLSLVPVALALTVLAIMQSLQEYVHALNSGMPNIVLPGIFITTCVYYWYFIPLAYVLGHVSRRLLVRASIFPRWLAMHGLLAFTSFLLHRIIVISVEDLTVQTAASTGSFFYRVFNNPSIWIDLFSYTLLILIFSLQEHRKIQAENEFRRLTLEEQLTRARLHELQTKVHPDFLFSTLAGIADLLRQSQHTEANRLLSLLSDFLRTTVYTINTDETTLEDELAFLQLYLDIEQVRSKGALEITRDVQHEARHAAIPHHILQPIAEAILTGHHVASGTNERLVIIARVNGETLKIILAGVFDDLELTTADMQSKEAALHIVKERLQQHFGNAHSFSVESTEEYDVSVSMFCRFKKRMTSMDNQSPVEGAP